MVPVSEAALSDPQAAPLGHLQGVADAPIQIVEYGDYQCPYTRRVQLQVLDPLLPTALDQLSFVYRHFPLERWHPLARGAAEASEIAGMKGHFWPMHARLFSRPRRLRPDDLLDHAATLGLERGLFADETVRRDAHRAVTRHVHAGLASNVRGTPWFLVNGERATVESVQDLLTSLSV